MEPLETLDLTDICGEWTSNDTETSIFSMGPDTWIVLYENKSSDGDLLSPVKRDSLLTYGAFLAVWSLVIGLTVVVLLLKTAESVWKRLPTVQFLCSQALLGSVVVSLTVLTEYKRRWQLDSAWCHVWLTCQVFLLALSSWSLLAAAVGHFIALKWTNYCQKRSRWISVGLSLSSLTVATIVTVPPGLLLQREDAVLEEVCAATMTRQYVLAVSVSTFLLPTSFLVLLTVTSLLYQICSSKNNNRVRYVIYKKPDCDKCSNKKIFQESPRKGYTKCPTVQEAGYNVEHVQPAHVSCSVLCVASLLYVALWMPFHAANLLVSTCQGFCLHPTLWSLFIWLGYSSVGVMPVIFLFSREVRAALKMNVCCACTA